MKVFIAGPRAISELNEDVKQKLENICIKNYEVFVGDAYGVDSCVQRFLCQKNYRNVTIFVSGESARNNYGNWNTRTINVDSNVSGFEFYAQKDIEMAKMADIGFMIWNGKSKGTFNNIINLLKMKKEVVLYFAKSNNFYDFKDLNEFNNFLKRNVKLSSNLRKIIPKVDSKEFVQVGLF